jgi:hypothetical protein
LSHRAAALVSGNTLSGTPDRKKRQFYLRSVQPEPPADTLIASAWSALGFESSEEILKAHRTMKLLSTFQ